MSDLSIDTLQKAKKETLANVEKDGYNKAMQRFNTIASRRGGKFKISDKQFIEEMQNMWIAGEFSAAERILRAIEIDPDLNSKDMIRGELHLFIISTFELLKKRLNLSMNLGVEDLLWGKYTTETVLENFEARKQNEQ